MKPTYRVFDTTARAWLAPPSADPNACRVWTPHKTYALVVSLDEFSALVKSWPFVESCTLVPTNTEIP